MFAKLEKASRDCSHRSSQTQFLQIFLAEADGMIILLYIYILFLYFVHSLDNAVVVLTARPKVAFGKGTI